MITLRDVSHFFLLQFFVVRLAVSGDNRITSLHGTVIIRTFNVQRLQ